MQVKNFGRHLIENRHPFKLNTTTRSQLLVNENYDWIGTS